LIRLLLDQGIPRSTGAELLRKGWHAIHTSSVNLNTAPDTRILEYARREMRTVITLDADFHALLAVSGTQYPSGIRIRREGLHGSEMAELIDRVLTQVKTQIQRGAMVTVTAQNIRIHMLPVTRDPVVSVVPSSAD
jgi:predicted nuclease of predicted toxin-antitoxin system